MGADNTIFRHVLHVDDSRKIRAMIKKLMPNGFEFYDTTNDVETLKFITSYKFDVIILNINIPHLNNIKLLQTTHNKNINTPIILYTNKSHPKHIHKFLKLKINNFVLKPYNKNFLKKKIIFITTQQTIQINKKPTPIINNSTTITTPPSDSSSRSCGSSYSNNNSYSKHNNNTHNSTQ